MFQYVIDASTAGPNAHPLHELLGLTFSMEGHMRPQVTAGPEQFGQADV